MNERTKQEFLETRAKHSMRNGITFISMCGISLSRSCDLYQKKRTQCRMKRDFSSSIGTWMAWM